MPDPTIIEFDSNAVEQNTNVQTEGFAGIICQDREIALSSTPTLTDTFVGPWGDLLNYAFSLYESNPSDTIKGIKFGFSSARIKNRRKGLRGELVVSYKKVGTSASAEDEEDEDSVKWSVESVQVQSPVTAKNAFSGYADNIRLWRLSDPELRRVWKYQDGEDIFDLNGEALQVAQLLEKGVQNYLQFYPVVRKTTESAAAPAIVCGNLMKIGDPPDCPFNIAGSWEFLKTADHCEQLSDNRWRRIEIWTGAEKWERLLYETVDGGGDGGGGGGAS